MTEVMGVDDTGAVAFAVVPNSPADFAVWVRPHLPLLAIVAEHEVGAADRDDVVQEALIRAWRRRQTYDRQRGSVRGWLLAVLFDQARRHRIRHPWLARLPERPAASGEAPPRDSAVADIVDLDHAIRRLPLRQREVVVLHYLADLPIADVAAALGVSEGTVKSQLHDARARLRIVLGDEGG